ncbi:hypothetical protein BI049_gp259 [Salmonella phage vB_SnwM_CGG4-1]|uniref:Uncharacterized protein n=1 Tax=Salmonella phage vB_SnwM_CGG4-1 TaxID=1815631 RepID=A0A1B0VVX6_9CAUD|nr:hypothetical protein BI049_gp259 [Salmonella phage vB_SnwM_CGG4-1]ANA49474.1 hypothetical protein CGG41_119 [Salmonella phage vB_SnwM_CGG4-1]
MKAINVKAINMKVRYENQRRKANARNIEWLFTYESWLNWWISTGKLEKRGNKAQQYCMCRIGDSGPYSIENVYCATNSQNNKDLHTNGKRVDTRTKEQLYLAGVKLGKAGSAKAKIRGLELSTSQLNLIKDVDKTKFGWVSEASKILKISHSQVKRLVDKYYDGEIYRRKTISEA